MTEFYKEKFNRFYKSKLASLKKTNLGTWQRIQKGGGLTSTSKEEMDILMQQFFNHLFGVNILAGGRVNELEKQQVITSLMMIVFSHRYNKGDQFIIEAQTQA
jgi:hypothetical protein